MITKHIVIQKIEENGTIDVFQISSDYLQWTFETRRTIEESDKEYFPFVINGNINIIRRKAGAETKITAQKDKIAFIDDYGLPGGFVVGILFPKNFIPDIIKFKDKPFIPVGLAGQVSTTPPGQIQILYNQLEKRCAIIMNIHYPICFGFKCIAQKVKKELFPHSEETYAEDFFDILLSREMLDVEAIKNEDLKIINETLNETDLNDLNESLNEILYSLKSGEKSQALSVIKNIEGKIMNGSALAGTLTTIIDSYQNGGITEQFVGSILKYISL
ncbi:hypothetical protein PbJCM13498_34940 [Prolixibacter bellariivorans]|uniref:Uncharacterized protein n=1 Tax=Prolixibacter bellariivorans TaxID=314319 RepID=A0A5M4B418_9BACT|nr:hypothetical protein [Prolixibacter bellariivorans]GET34631.1 hypothetical protein PbJCM13498_34940 [Prolixibacter bellariivorans]